MEDRRTALALFFCFIVIILYSEAVLTPFMQQGRGSIQKGSPATTSTENSVQMATDIPCNPALPTTTSARQATTGQAAVNPATGKTAPAHKADLIAPTPSELEESGKILLKGRKWQIEISLLGGRITKLLLNDYKLSLEDPNPLDMVHHIKGATYPLGVYSSGGLSDLHVHYHLTSNIPAKKEAEGVYVINSNDFINIELSGIYPDGSTISKIFSFQRDNYLFDIKAALDNTSKEIWLDWNSPILPSDMNTSLEPWGFTYLTQSDDVA